jgi:hypothetical protein
MKLVTALVAALATFACSAAGAVGTVGVAKGDLITSTTQFNGFEGLDATLLAAPSSYTEGGITVNEVRQSDYASIWTTFGNDQLGFSGAHSWYANGGDTGFTRITEADGSDFTNISIVTGNGWGSPSTSDWLNYTLLNNGVVVGRGSLRQTLDAMPVTFTGGGFDEIWLTSTNRGRHPVGAFVTQALAIDDIRAGAIAAVPEPSSVATLLAGLAMLGRVARRRLPAPGVLAGCTFRRSTTEVT